MGTATLLKFEDPRVSLIGHFRQDQQVVAIEGLCRLPLLTVLVEVGEGDGVADATFGVVWRDGSLEGAGSLESYRSRSAAATFSGRNSKFAIEETEWRSHLPETDAQGLDRGCRSLQDRRQPLSPDAEGMAKPPQETEWRSHPLQKRVTDAQGKDRGPARLFPEDPAGDWPHNCAALFNLGAKESDATCRKYFIIIFWLLVFSTTPALPNTCPNLLFVLSTCRVSRLFKRITV